MTYSLYLLYITTNYALGPRRVNLLVIVAIDLNSLSYIQSNILSTLSLVFWECSHGVGLWELYIYPWFPEFPSCIFICKLIIQRHCIERYFLSKRNWRILFHRRDRVRSEPKVWCVANIKCGASRDGTCWVLRKSGGFVFTAQWLAFTEVIEVGSLRGTHLQVKGSRVVHRKMGLQCQGYKTMMKSVRGGHLPDFSLPHFSRRKLAISAPGPANVAGIKVVKLVSVITVLSLTVSSNTCFLINWNTFTLWKTGYIFPRLNWK